MDTTKIILKSGKDQSLRRLHPWVFSGAIKKIYGYPKEGNLVEIYSNQDEFLALGHYQIGSIAVRVLSFTEKLLPHDFYDTAILNAYTLRKNTNVISEQTNCYRLIHAEGDFLPGLIIDIYDKTAVVQMHSVGMFCDREKIFSALKNVLGESIDCIYNKSENTLPFKAETGAKDGCVMGNRLKDTALENGIKFSVNWQEGQKTGFFLDQRENRRLVEQYSKGRNVLNMFCYTGGFSVYAMRGGAKLVHSVDSSAKAIDLTNENIQLNFANDPRHEAFAVDAFSYLDNMDETYDLIILDPPAFAKHNNVLANALQGYKKLNAKALRKIKKGGILFTFSCSQVVSKENFRKSVFAACANTGRKARILHQVSQPIDHPINMYHPEGEYLKGLVLQID